MFKKANNTVKYTDKWEDLYNVYSAILIIIMSLIIYKSAPIIYLNRDQLTSKIKRNENNYPDTDFIFMLFPR